jgi:peptide/nickel transport system permease protein
MAELLGGIVMVETVFGWPGMGRLAVQAMASRDLFLLQGIVMLVGCFFLFTNFMADIAYHLLDPRLRTRLAPET